MVCHLCILSYLSSIVLILLTILTVEMFTLGLLVILGNISFLFGQSNEKRLLLNDQDVIHQELQTLRNRMTQLENENSLMKKQLQNTQGMHFAH